MDPTAAGFDGRNYGEKVGFCRADALVKTSLTCTISLDHLEHRAINRAHSLRP